MKNFDQLFAQALEVSDKRKKVYNELIEKTKSEILPAFAKACRGLDIKKVYFKSSVQPFSGMEKQTGYEHEEPFAFGINVENNTLKEYEYRFNGIGFEYSDTITTVDINFNDVPFLRTGIVPFVKALRSRLESYINRYDDKNQEAETLLGVR